MTSSREFEPDPAPDTPTGVAADPPDSCLAAARRRLLERAEAPLLLAAAGALALVP